MTENKPFFSVIIPVYNGEKTIAKTIESVLLQDFRDYEIIVINDGSIDSTEIICKEFEAKDKRVFLINKKNEGVACARNEGIKKSRGEFLCFLDSDDVVYPQWLSNYRDLSKQHDLLVQGYHITGSEIDSVRKPIDRVFTKSSLEQGVLELIRSGTLNSPWSKSYRASIVKNNSIFFWVGCNLFEDLIFSLQFLQKTESIVTSSSVGYEYRLFDSVLTKKFNPSNQYLEWTEKVCDEARKLFANDGPSLAYKKILTSQYALLGWYLIQFFSKIKYKDRELIYMQLRKIEENVLFKEIPMNRRIFKMKFFLGIDLMSRIFHYGCLAKNFLRERKR